MGLFRCHALGTFLLSDNEWKVNVIRGVGELNWDDVGVDEDAPSGVHKMGDDGRCAHLAGMI